MIDHDEDVTMVSLTKLEAITVSLFSLLFCVSTATTED